MARRLATREGEHVVQMMRLLLLTLITIVALAGPLSAVADEDTLSEIAKKLEAYEKEAERLKTIGYSGPVLQKDFKTLASRVQALKKELASIDPTAEPESDIAIHRQEYGGPAFKGNAVSSDTLAFSTVVALAGSESEPVLTSLIWQLLDSAGNPVKGVENKVTEIAAKGGSGVSQRVLPMTGLKNGTYTIRFVHSANGETDERTRKFNVWQRVRAKRAVISLSDPPKKHLKSVVADANFNAFILMDMVEKEDKADVSFSFISRSSGKIIYEYSGVHKRKGDTLAQKSGLPVTAGTLPKHIPMIFKGRVTDADGVVSEVSASFIIRDHQLAIDAPASIRAGSAKSFSIRPPKYFEKPLDIRVTTFNEGLVIRHDQGSLQGRFSGVTNDRKKITSFSVKVTDATGKIASGVHSVNILPVPKAPAQVATNSSTATSDRPYIHNIWTDNVLMSSLAECLRYQKRNWDIRRTNRGSDVFYVVFTIDRREDGGRMKYGYSVGFIDAINTDRYKAYFRREAVEDINVEPSGEGQITRYISTVHLREAYDLAVRLCKNPKLTFPHFEEFGANLRDVNANWRKVPVSWSPSLILKSTQFGMSGKFFHKKSRGSEQIK